MPEASPETDVLPQSDPRVAAQTVRRIFKKITQEIDVEKYGLSGLITAIQKAIGVKGETLEHEDQQALVEFFGAEAAGKFMLFVEDVPSISPERARTITDWFETFMRAVRSDADPQVIWRLGRKVGVEYINALADRTIRS